MGYRIAVVGATGNVGREMLNILADRHGGDDERHISANVGFDFETVAYPGFYGGKGG